MDDLLLLKRGAYTKPMSHRSTLLCANRLDFSLSSLNPWYLLLMSFLSTFNKHFIRHELPLGASFQFLQSSRVACFGPFPNSHPLACCLNGVLRVSLQPQSRQFDGRLESGSSGNLDEVIVRRWGFPRDLDSRRLYDFPIDSVLGGEETEIPSIRVKK